MKNHLTQKELEGFELDHKHCTGGLYWLCDLGDDMHKICFCTPNAPEGAISQVRLAAGHLLSVHLKLKHAPTKDKPNPEMIPAPIHPDVRVHLDGARHALKTGSAQVVDQRLVLA